MAKHIVLWDQRQYQPNLCHDCKSISKVFSYQCTNELETIPSQKVYIRSTTKQASCQETMQEVNVLLPPPPTPSSRSPSMAIHLSHGYRKIQWMNEWKKTPKDALYSTVSIRGHRSRSGHLDLTILLGCTGAGCSSGWNDTMWCNLSCSMACACKACFSACANKMQEEVHVSVC